MLAGLFGSTARLQGVLPGPAAHTPCPCGPPLFASCSQAGRWRAAGSGLPHRPPCRPTPASGRQQHLQPVPCSGRRPGSLQRPDQRAAGRHTCCPGHEVRLRPLPHRVHLLGVLLQPARQGQQGLGQLCGMHVVRIPAVQLAWELLSAHLLAAWPTTGPDKLPARALESAANTSLLALL